MTMSLPAPVAARTVLFALSLAVGSVLPVAGQSHITNEVDTTLVTVGDRITMTVSVEHTAGSTVTWPDSLDLSPFEVLEVRVLPAAATADGGALTRAVLTLTAFELGELEIPGFTVDVVGPGDAVETLTTSGFGVEVVSVGADESGDIRDIRGPLAIPVSALLILGWILPLLLLALAAYWLYRRRQRREAPSAPIPAGPPPRPPHEIALEALDALEVSGMLERGQVKDYHIQVSAILRTFVEGRWSVDALELTTTEVVEGLERAAVAADLRAGLQQFLERCDLVKFAKVRPDSDASREVLALGRRLVIDARPASVTEPGEQDEQNERGEQDDIEPTQPTEAATAPGAGVLPTSGDH